MLAPSLASLALLSSAVVVSASSHRAGRFPHKKAADGLAKRRDGGSNARATWYDTSVGLGACGILHQNNEFTVALNSDQLREWGGGYPSAACGQTITIQYTNSDGSTSTQQATIQDECPTCPYGGLDLSQGLFTAFASESVGVLSINWWYGGGGGSPAPATTTSEAPAPTTSEAPAPTTSEAPAPVTTEAPAPVTTSTTEEAAYTPASSSAEAASSSAAADFNVGAAVVPAESSSSSSSSSPEAVPTTTSVAAPAETWVAPTTSSTAEWVAPVTSSAEAWIAPTTTAAAWSAAAPSASATPEPVLDGQTLCPFTPQFVVLAQETVLYNGTVLSFLNESLAATANATLFNATSPYDLADYVCYNATLFSVDLYEASTANATLASVVANVTTPTTFGLFKTNATIVSFAAKTNETFPAANATFLLGTNVTLASFEAHVAATANVTTAELLAAASSGADNSTSHALVEIFDMLAASRSTATATCLEQSIVDKIEVAEAPVYEDDDSLPWCDDDDEDY